MILTVAFHGDSKTERNDIQEEEVCGVGRCGLAGNDSCDSGSQLSEHQERKLRSLPACTAAP